MKTSNKKVKQKTDMNSTKNPTMIEYLYQVKVCGGSCHVQIPRRWLGKLVKVKIEEVKE